MEDDILLNRPSDRRLVDSDLPPGPPGAENDTFDLVQKQPKSKKDNDSHHSPSLTRSKDPRLSSARAKERSSSRGRTSPSPRGRRTPSPPSRRNRRSTSRERRDRRSNSRNRETINYGRDYSPRRRFGDGRRGRRSRERKRSPIRRDRLDRRRDHRSRSRDRYRGRRTPSRSASPPRSHRWSPIGKKPASPPVPPPPTVTTVPMAAPPQFGVPPPNVYADAYAGYPPPQYGAQQFQNEYGASIPPPPSFSTAYPPPPAWGVVPGPSAEDFTSQTVGWTHAVQVPPPQQQPIETEEDQQKREAAVAQEVQNQREQLKKQRNDYLKRAAALKREMKILKQQRNYLVSGDAPPSPTTKGFLDENDNLQNQIQKKLSTIENVIDMLNGIIGDEKHVASPPSSPVAVASAKKSKSSSTKKSSSSGGVGRNSSKVDDNNDGNDDRYNDDIDNDDDNSSTERLKSKLMESMKNKRDAISKKDKEKEKEKRHHRSDDKSPADKFTDMKIKDEKSDDVHPARKINYIFYDPEMHWCQNCNVFPKTAKDYLNHLHSQQHKDNVDVADTPWHDSIKSDDFPNYPNVSTKRAPIRGLQFFVPATSWFCKLCSFWMGDLHCASAHLKSQTHSDKYNQFFEQNPHFEMDWMADRQRIYDKLRAPPPPPQITSVSTTGMDLLESIPLQINTQKSIENEKTKKRKKKSDDKKDKKRKKRTKKRKKAETSSSSSATSSDSSSSSSSSSSENEESTEKMMKEKAKKIKDVLLKDAEQQGNNVANAQHSIRVAMRNLSTSRKSHENGGVGGDNDNGSSGRGKWTTIQESQARPIEPVAPPPPKIVTPPLVDPDTKKKDELMMSQWNTPVQPVISESEKKLLEELKGKLKSKPSEEQQKKKDIDSKRKDEKDRRSRSKDRSARGRSSRDQKSVRSRDRRSRSRDRRAGSRDRNRGKVSPGRRRRRSRSPSNRYGGRRRSSRSRTQSRSRSRTHSRSRSKSSEHRIEKAVVRYPEFRPRVPPPENKKLSKVKTEEESEQKRSSSLSKKKDQQSSSGDNKKKLPFIGRMPVFKKQSQGNESEKKEGENENGENSSVVENQSSVVAQKNQQQQQPQLKPQSLPQPQLIIPQQPQLLQQPQVLQQQQQHQVPMNFENYYDYDDLMPDPMQYVTLMGAPPPPPAEPPPLLDEDDDQDILPPGVDETETDLIPQPISDAPTPKTGPLPKDFEEALNIIFPAENKPTDENKSDADENTEKHMETISAAITAEELSNPPNTVFTDAINVTETIGTSTASGVAITAPAAMDDDVSQVSIGAYPPLPVGAVINHSEISQEVTSYLQSSSIPPTLPPNVDIYNEQELQFETIHVTMDNDKDKRDQLSPTNSEKIRRQEELDDLAMLGIDADDLAAQCM